MQPFAFYHIISHENSSNHDLLNQYSMHKLFVVFGYLYLVTASDALINVASDLRQYLKLNYDIIFCNVVTTCRRYCRGRGGDLFWSTSNKESQIALDLVKSRRRYHWIGLRSDVRCSFMRTQHNIVIV